MKFLLSLKVEDEEDEEKSSNTKHSQYYLNVSAVDRFGTSPLQNALDGKHSECVELLIQAGAVLGGMSNLQLAVRLNTIVMDKDVESLHLHVVVGQVNVNVGDYDARTPLHIACSERNVECIGMLLKGNGDPYLKDRWQTTPLDLIELALKDGDHSSPSLREELQRLCQLMKATKEVK